MVAETGTKATATGRRPSMFRRIFVYCWSAKGQNASYQDAAVDLGKELVVLGLVHGRMTSVMARPRVAPYGFGYLRPGRSDGGGTSPATRSSWSSSLFASQSMGEPTSRDGSVLGVSSDVNKAMSTMMQARGGGNLDAAVKELIDMGI